MRQYLPLFLLPMVAMAGELESLQQRLPYIETMVVNLERLHARSAPDAPAFCRSEIATLADNASQNVAYAALFIGRSEVTDDAGAVMIRLSTLRAYCTRATDSRLKRKPTLVDARQANAEITPIEERFTIAVRSERADLVKEIERLRIGAPAPEPEPAPQPAPQPSAAPTPPAPRVSERPWDGGGFGVSDSLTPRR